MGTQYNQLTEGERCTIYRLHTDGLSCAEIGRRINRGTSTISRELKRNALKSGYVPVSAERMALTRRHQKRTSKIERTDGLLDTVREQLVTMGRSPEQIAGRLAMEHGKPVISHEAIYRFVHSSKGRKDKLHHALPQGKAKRGRRARKNGKLLIPHRVSIHDRPLAIAERAVCGDWEGDLMAFSKPKHNNVVMVERRSRYMLAAPQADKTAETTTASLKSLLAPLPDSFKRSITFDNGGEFARHFSLGVSTFFCDPHSPWQKGSVENAIGRLRRDLPRTTKPSDYTDDDFYDIIDRYNDTPRKCLGFKTPTEVLFAEFNVMRCA
jgi:IS30 family transposase